MILLFLKWSLAVTVTITFQKYHGVINEEKGTVKNALLITYREMNP